MNAEERAQLLVALGKAEYVERQLGTVIPATYPVAGEARDLVTVLRALLTRPVVEDHADCREPYSSPHFEGVGVSRHRVRPRRPAPEPPPPHRTIGEGP